MSDTLPRFTRAEWREKGYVTTGEARSVLRGNYQDMLSSLRQAGIERVPGIVIDATYSGRLSKTRALMVPIDAVAATSADGDDPAIEAVHRATAPPPCRPLAAARVLVGVGRCGPAHVQLLDPGQCPDDAAALLPSGLVWTVVEAQVDAPLPIRTLTAKEA